MSDSDFKNSPEYDDWMNLVVEMKITVTTMKNGIEELNDNSRR